LDAPQAASRRRIKVRQRGAESTHGAPHANGEAGNRSSRNAGRDWRSRSRDSNKASMRLFVLLCLALAVRPVSASQGRVLPLPRHANRSRPALLYLSAAPGRCAEPTGTLTWAEGGRNRAKGPRSECSWNVSTLASSQRCTVPAPTVDYARCGVRCQGCCQNGRAAGRECAENAQTAGGGRRSSGFTCRKRRRPGAPLRPQCALTGGTTRAIHGAGIPVVCSPKTDPGVMRVSEVDCGGFGREGGSRGEAQEA